MNKVVLMGRLTRDPEVRYSQGEHSTAIANYTLAVDRPRRGQQEQQTDFIRCVAFGKSAEFAEKYLRQGTKLLVCGRIQTGSYTNKDGQKVYTTDVIIEEQEFAESKGSGNNSQNAAYQQPAPAPMPNPMPATMPQQAPMPNQMPAPAYEDGFMNIPDGLDEELPFN